MTCVAIIDYGMCNLDSMARAVEECGGEAMVTESAADLDRASHVILPGVGSFAEAMANLRSRNLDALLTEHVLKEGLPFLGVCLGMQLLAEVGLEGGRTDGLGWFPGEVRRLESPGGDERIPHVGWNEVHPDRENPLFDGIKEKQDFYFVHSYTLHCSRAEDILARTPYCGGFISAVQRDNLYATQFHPEKSQRPGFRVLKNFLAL